MKDEHVYGFSFNDANDLLAGRGGGTGREVRLHQRPSGSPSRLFLTPVGGIPAMTGTSSPWTPGVASCTECEFYLDGSTMKIRTTSATFDVYNTTKTAVGGNTLIQTKMINNYIVIDTEDCGG